MADIINARLLWYVNLKGLEKGEIRKNDEKGT